MPEREAVYPFLTGREFALLNARLQGLPDPDGAAARAIATVELTDAADRPIGTYSKGMRQRAKIAGALVHDPPILLLDEPFNGMDPRQRLHMMELLRRMAGEGRTILFSSHILEEVERLAQNVLVIVAGRLAASGRLPRDPPADDRPAAHVHDPLVATTAGWRPALVGRARRLRRRADRRPARGPDLGLRGVHPGARRDRPRRRRCRSSRSARPTRTLESVFGYLVRR